MVSPWWIEIRVSFIGFKPLTFVNFCLIVAAPVALESTTAPAAEKKEEKKKEESENESDDDMGFGKC